MKTNLFKEASFYISFLFFFVLLSQTVFAVKHIIQVSNTTFTPANFSNVFVGDTMRWQWNAGTHTTKSIPQSIPSGAPEWSSNINSALTYFEYKVLVPGTYNYICAIHGGFNASGLTSGMSGNFVVSGSTGIGEVIPNFNAFLAPKSNNDMITLNLHGTSGGKGLIVIYDIQGKEVQREETEIQPGLNTLHCSMSLLNKGLYFVEVYADKKRVGIQRVVKE